MNHEVGGGGGGGGDCVSDVTAVYQ